MPIPLTRSLVVATARGWTSTPYVHQQSVKGAGTDCLGFVRGVWRELIGDEPEMPPAYSQDWAEASGEETLRDAARRHLGEIAVQDASAGDVVLFRARPHAPAKHCAILTGPGRMIHAYAGHHVAECFMGKWWQRRLAYAFRFPGLTD
jgi:NlpC/P60 family putative phage cell wall peptidase